MKSPPAKDCGLLFILGVCLTCIVIWPGFSACFDAPPSVKAHSVSLRLAYTNLRCLLEAVEQLQLPQLGALRTWQQAHGSIPGADHLFLSQVLCPDMDAALVSAPYLCGLHK